MTLRDLIAALERIVADTPAAEFARVAEAHGDALKPVYDRGVVYLQNPFDVEQDETTETGAIH